MIYLAGLSVLTDYYKTTSSVAHSATDPSRRKDYARGIDHFAMMLTALRTSHATSLERGTADGASGS